MKYNWKELVEILNGLVGEEIEVDAVENNGRKQLFDENNKRIGTGRINTSVSHYKGKLEKIETGYGKFDIKLHMNCHILNLFSILDDPVYQAGISKITCRAISPYPIYVNDSIVNFPDCYIHTAHEVFD